MYRTDTMPSPTPANAPTSTIPKNIHGHQSHDAAGFGAVARNRRLSGLPTGRGPARSLRRCATGAPRQSRGSNDRREVHVRCAPKMTYQTVLRTRFTAQVRFFQRASPAATRSTSPEIPQWRTAWHNRADVAAARGSSPRADRAILGESQAWAYSDFIVYRRLGIWEVRRKTTMRRKGAGDQSLAVARRGWTRRVTDGISAAA